eukprot:3416027-Rhodomonas_salina.1
MSDQPGAVAEDLPLKRGIDDVTAVEGGQAEAGAAGAAESSPPIAAGADEEPKGQADTSADSVDAMATEAADEADRFTVVVNFKKQKLEISVRPSDLVADIKAKLEDMTGVEKANQKLMFKGMLQDASTTEAAGLKEGAKIMLIGTPTQEIRMEALAAVVAHTMQPAAGAAAAPKKGERLQDQTEHKKVVEKGVPPGADKGQSGRKHRIQIGVLHGVWCELTLGHGTGSDRRAPRGGGAAHLQARGQPAVDRYALRCSPARNTAAPQLETHPAICGFHKLCFCRELRACACRRKDADDKAEPRPDPE